MLTIPIHLLLLLFMPPLLLGVINKTKALFAGRNGPPLLQPYFDLIRLAQKGMVFSTTTTWIFRAGPLVTLAAVFLAGLMIPLGNFNAPLRFTGDLILFAYLFGLARFFTTSAAMDTGSPFEGMGSAREVTFACLSEPAIFLAFLVLVKLSNSLSLTRMLNAPHTDHIAAVALIAAGLFIVLLAENCRIPVDDPNTHLELTMIHEVMVLDHSGPLFGAVLYSASIKLFILSALVLHLLMPFQTGWMILDWPIFLIGMIAIAVAIGVIESIMARLQLRHVPTLLVAASLLCGFGFLLMQR
jgi:formate hydrogenlyase subunit 4